MFPPRFDTRIEDAKMKVESKRKGLVGLNDIFKENEKQNDLVCNVLWLRVGRRGGQSQVYSFM